MNETSSSNSNGSLPFTTGSSTTSISSSLSSLLSPITSHRPLCRIPAVTDFSSLVSRSPVPAPPPISQQQWLTGMTSSSNSLMASRPSTTPCNNISLRRQEEGPLVLRKLSRCPNFTMGCHRSFTNGGRRPRSGLRPSTPPPLTEKRQQRYSHAWKGLVQAVMHRFASMSAWRPTLGPHGQNSRPRSRASSCPEITRSGQGPNSCVFVRVPARGSTTS